MKKNLLLGMFCLAVSPAYAGDVFYEYSGIGNSFYGYTDYTEYNYGRPKHNHTPINAEIYTAVGYNFDETTLVKLGVDAEISGGKEIEDYNHNKWGENVYASFVSEYGELSGGQIYNAAYQLAVGAPSVGSFKVNNSLIADFIANPNWQRNSRVASFRTVNSTYLNTDADAPKISYTTPEFYDTKLAFSYTPDSYSEAGLINKHSSYDNRSSYAVGLYKYIDLYYLAIESSLGYAYNHKNDQEVSAGIAFYRKGWTLGASYRKNYTSSSDYSLNETHNNKLPFYYDGYRRSYAYNVGLSYEIGPFTTGVSYFFANADKTPNKDEIVSWSNRYALDKNVAFYLTGAYARYRGIDKSDNNQGTAYIGGIEVRF